MQWLVETILSGQILSPEAPSSFLLYMCTATLWTFGFFLYFCVQNNQFTGRRKYYSMVHLQYCHCCSLESPLRKTPHVWTPETPTSFLFKSPDCECFKDSMNKQQEHLFDWSCLFSNICGTQTWDSFTWTLKQGGSKAF